MNTMFSINLMKILTKFLTDSLIVVLTIVFAGSIASAQNDMRFFITRDADKLIENGKEYRFVSFNIPNLHLVEDNMAFEATNEWRFPDDFEITDALTSVKQMGGRAVRIYVISICRQNQPNPIPCHVKKPGEFDEAAFQALDRVLAIANRVGVRVIIPFVDNWKWWGGREDYAAWRGKTADEFWTDRQIIEDFKQTVKYVINRRNTVTGTLYKDDKAVFAWETGNELFAPYSWTKEIAALIKSEDKNHLVWDGLYLGQKPVQPEALDDPNIDIVSSHHYPDATNQPGAMAQNIAQIKREIGSKKVYVAGEFGFVPLTEAKAIFDTVINNKISGALAWSLRFHNRDGGFYWHSEGSGGGLYKAYHYPGFKNGAAYEETALLDLMREKAFEINGDKAPAIEKPEPPRLLPIKSAHEISWQGSVGATAYDIERRANPNGKWEIVGRDVDDSSVQYKPLFADSTAETGKTYFYRVSAKNRAGTSAPSNISNAVKVDAQVLVDELTDFSKTSRHDAELQLVSTDARAYKEDDSRVKGAAENSLVYQTAGALKSAKIRTFMENAATDFEFYVSADNQTFVKIEPKVSRFPTEVNPYGYKLPISYEIADAAGKNRFLKIVYKTDAQISRVEIKHGK